MQSEENRFEAVFRDHFDAVLRFALARADPDAARDVAAETFMAAWQAFDRLPPEPRGWLIAVARNKVADHYRAGERREVLVSRIAQIFPASSADQSDTALELGPVSVAFHSLNRADQEVLRLLAWDGLTHPEAAEAMGWSSRRFAVRLHRARKRLRAALLQSQHEPVRASPSAKETT